MEPIHPVVSEKNIKMQKVYLEPVHPVVSEKNIKMQKVYLEPVHPVVSEKNIKMQKYTWSQFTLWFQRKTLKCKSIPGASSPCGFREKH